MRRGGEVGEGGGVREDGFFKILMFPMMFPMFSMDTS